MPQLELTHHCAFGVINGERHIGGVGEMIRYPRLWVEWIGIVGKHPRLRRTQFIYEERLYANADGAARQRKRDALRLQRPWGSRSVLNLPNCPLPILV